MQRSTHRHQPAASELTMVWVNLEENLQCFHCLFLWGQPARLVGLGRNFTPFDGLGWVVSLSW